MEGISLDGKWKYFIDEDDSGEENGVWRNEFDKQNWEEVEIPCNWYVGLNLDYNGIVWFSRSFEVSPEWKEKIVRLCFNGVDYFAKVWINGYYVGFHEGYFGHFQFDISDKIDFDNPKNNKIVVQVNAPFDEGFNKSQPFASRKRYFKGGFSHWDCRPGGSNKKHGQERGSGGIWDSVLLKISNKIYINHVKLVSNDISQKTSRVQIKISGYNSNPSSLVNFSLNIKVSPKNFDGQEQDFTIKIKELLSGDFTIEDEIQIDKPQLWWTWDLGKPNLYKIKISINSQEETLDNWEGTFGIRSIEYKKDGWYLNNEKIFLRGANFFSNLWLSKMDDEAYAKTVSDVKEANLNFLRISYHVEKYIFYDHIDETGILLQQDFPTLWNYVYTKESINAAIKQSKEMAIQLHNRPSIAIFSCWTEPSNADNFLMAKTLKKHVDSEDLLGRTVWSESAVAAHPFCGWYFGTKYGYLLCPGAPYPSEFGPQSFPSINSPTWNKDNLNVRENWPPNTKWEYHNSQNFLHYYLSKATPNLGLKKMIENSQAYQADNLKFSIEAFRRCKKQMHMFALFMFKDAWPGITWSIIDYFNLRKKAYYAVKEACSPVLCSFSLITRRVPYKPLQFLIIDAALYLWGPIVGMFWNEIVSPGQKKPIHIHFTNDLIEKIYGSLILKGESDGKVFFEKKLDVEIEPSSSRLSIVLNLKIGKEVKESTIKIKADLYDKKSNKLLSTNSIDLYVKTKWKRIGNSLSHFVLWTKNLYYQVLQGIRAVTSYD